MASDHTVVCRDILAGACGLEGVNWYAERGETSGDTYGLTASAGASDMIG